MCVGTAIDAGGTTLRDYVSLMGPGFFEQQLAVYGREGSLGAFVVLRFGVE
ncbi:MAG: hypothetical protein CM1200mP41_30910 [Gammaproteobacteria bacterium]|nr:MAG: hypothetical protein CM1200mP41_30910 [Gammaproteobacteria bacterium]